MKKILLGLAILAFSAIPTIAQNNEGSGKTTLYARLLRTAQIPAFA